MKRKKTLKTIKEWRVGGKRKFKSLEKAYAYELKLRKKDGIFRAIEGIIS